MKHGRDSAILTLLFLAMSWLPAVVRAESPPSKRVLVLYWYNKDYLWNVKFDESFQASAKSAGPVEYYAEYLETNRFPGERQSLVLRDYLRQKYADHNVDVVVASSDPPLDFLLENRQNLFPQTPIVFISVRHLSPEQLAAGPGMTGIININTHKKTLDLALRLHPNTENVFIVSGTLEHDGRFERLAREELKDYEGRIRITYVTDMEPNQLVARVKDLPQRSIVLYVWQQAPNEQGNVLESADLLGLMCQSASVPIYRLSNPSYSGPGSVGGYINAAEVIGRRAAEIAVQIANGTQPQDIPVEGAPTVPMFDWRELQRWGISESKLPPGSIIRFKEQTFWGQYKWRIVGVIALLILETLLILGLLLQRSRRARAEESRRLSEEKFSKAFRSSPDAFSITRQSDGTILEVNDRWEALTGYMRTEAIGRTTIDLGLYVDPEARQKFLSQVVKDGYIRNFETNIRNRHGYIKTVELSSEGIDINNEPSLIVMIRDVTEQRNSERAIRNMAGQLIHLQDEEQRRIAAELHDGLGQSLSIIRNRAIICMMDKSDRESIREQLEEISATAVSAINEVREIAHNLRPYELDRLGLVAAVRSMVNKVSDATSIHLVSYLDQIDGLLSPSAETSVYRIVQEGLNNVVKHADASEARVGIRRTAREVIVSVEDNGKGFGLNPETTGRHNGDGFGLVGIAERVRMLGGIYEIVSKPGAGTTLTIRLKVNDKLTEK